MPSTCSIVPGVLYDREDCVVGMVLWTYWSKRGEFHHFTVTVRVSRVRVRFSFSDRVGIGLPSVE